MNPIPAFTTQSSFRLLTCKPSANKPGGIIDTTEEEDDSSPTTFSHRVLHSSSFQGRGKICVRPCPSPIVDLQQQIDTGATRVFTATSGIRGIDSGEHEMMTGQPKKHT
ncbi:hypothetical protein CEXT_560281 [Caerostris extrusa]|uniref:Uncharacterized protein n=1 Tax=Caerostris extrusa TaxID=172846 RepID=A0AAV4MIC9_CAEEX|nr:hypothetical protein CEXT_560281 [Caerostris extrusa]